MRTNTALEKAIEANKKYLESGHIVVLKNLTTGNYVLLIRNHFLRGVGVMAFDCEKLDPCFLTSAYDTGAERPSYQRVGILEHKYVGFLTRHEIKQVIRRLVDGTK